jgi:long-chain acyl-CoA synthetase
MGMAQIGAVHVPIYPSISMEEFSYILNHCEAKLLLVSGQELYEKLKPLTAQITSIRGFYTFDEIKEAKNWTEITKTGKQNSEKLSEKLQLIKDSINPDDLLTITYTSGTTGVSKGVMLSHKNFISNLQGLEGVHPYNKDQRVLSFLPLCHALERCANYLFQYHGTSIYYAESLAALPENLKEVKPHGFITVPHLLEKFYNRIIARGKDLPYILKIIFFWAVRLGFEFDFNKSIFYRIKLGIARKLIFTKWQQAFGGNIVTIICGGAALQTRLERLFWAAGIKVQNGYGLTEYSPVITGNHFDEAFVKFGTVGPGIKNVEIRIAEDGEILAKGPSIMLGYYKEPEITKTVIDDEGWLHTGDIGEIVDSIFLKVTDRKKEMFKLSTGKYVAPQVIENKLKESLFIERTVVIGDGKKFAAAVILPNFSFLHDWCSRKKIKYHDNSKLIKIPEVIARYQREVDF